MRLSLAKVSESELDADATDISEFNCFTLMEEWDPLIVVLLEECGAMDRFDEDNTVPVRIYWAHLSSGVFTIDS